MKPTISARKPYRAAGIGALAVLIATAPAGAQVVRQLTDVKTGSSTAPAIDDSGTEVFVSSSTNQLGGNAAHAFQLFRFDTASGAGSQLTTATDGIANGAFVVSVSDDDQWVAFLSRDNPTAQNPDRGAEVFVVKRDGTSLQQLTTHPGPGAGEPLIVTMAGGGAKVAFTSTGDLTGANPGHHAQVFVVNRDGTGLTQVTSLSGGDVDFLAISDDATKIVFGADANPLGTNADGNVEVFAIGADGSGLKQLTNTTDPREGNPAVGWVSFAGGGSRVAFSGHGNPVGTNADGGSEVFCVDYAGTNLRQLTSSTAPGGSSRDSEYGTITDDGATVYFTSNQFTTAVNRDGSFELWKINADGTGKTLLTNNGIEYADLVVSGSGNRLAFRDGSGDDETKVIDTSGLNLRVLTSTTRYTAEYASIDGAGARVAFASTADLLPPGNSGHTAELFTVHSDGTALAQLTSGMQVDSPSIARNGGSIVFSSTSNVTGGNPDGSPEVFQIGADGSGLRQLTHLTNSPIIYVPVASRDGSVIVFMSNSNDTGQNADRGYEEFKINSDGTGFAQLTQSPDGSTFAAANRIDDAGVWLTFQSDANLDGAHGSGTSDIWRMRTDGTGLQAITNGGLTGRGDYPDISGDGSEICFNGSFDLTGGNPDHNVEIFLWQSGTFRQLTSTTEGASYYCRFSDNGQWVYFVSQAPIFEDNPGQVVQFYRANVATGVVERVDGLGFGAPYDSPATDYGSANFPAVDDTGDHAVLAVSANATRANPDFFKEVMLYDRATAAAIRVSSGPAPTRVSWDVESGPVRYDVIRGNLANVHLGATTVELGAVACLANDSPVPSTEGSDDGVAPAPGQVFFYVYRGSQGLAAGPGSYGTGSGGKARVAGSGDCLP